MQKDTKDGKEDGALIWKKVGLDFLYVCVFDLMVQIIWFLALLHHFIVLDKGFLSIHIYLLSESVLGFVWAVVLAVCFCAAVTAAKPKPAIDEEPYRFHSQYSLCTVIQSTFSFDMSFHAVDSHRDKRFFLSR